jgi:hypothetical protein
MVSSTSKFNVKQSCGIIITDVTGKVVEQRTITDNTGEIVQFNIDHVAEVCTW